VRKNSLILFTEIYSMKFIIVVSPEIGSKTKLIIMKRNNLKN